MPIGNVVNKGITIRANQASVKRLLPKLIDHVQKGILDPKALITHRLPLEEVADAYRIFSDKLDGCIKPVSSPRGPMKKQRRHGKTSRISKTSGKRTFRDQGVGRGRGPEERPHLPDEAPHRRGVPGLQLGAAPPATVDVEVLHSNERPNVTAVSAPPRRLPG